MKKYFDRKRKITFDEVFDMIETGKEIKDEFIDNEIFCSKFECNHCIYKTFLEDLLKNEGDELIVKRSLPCLNVFTWFMKRFSLDDRYISGDFPHRDLYLAILDVMESWLKRKQRNKEFVLDYKLFLSRIYPNFRENLLALKCSNCGTDNINIDLRVTYYKGKFRFSIKEVFCNNCGAKLLIKLPVFRLAGELNKKFKDFNNDRKIK